jgi:hypothetical protein
VCLKNAVGFESERFWVLSKRLLEGNIGNIGRKKRAAQALKDAHSGHRVFFRHTLRLLFDGGHSDSNCGTEWPPFFLKIPFGPLRNIFFTKCE